MKLTKKASAPTKAGMKGAAILVLMYLALVAVVGALSIGFFDISWNAFVPEVGGPTITLLGAAGALGMFLFLLASLYIVFKERP
jgi:hypothetical protein